MLFADDEDDLKPTETGPHGTRDPRTTSATAFKLARFLTPEERAEVARRGRFRFAPWLRLVIRDETPADTRDDDLPP